MPLKFNLDISIPSEKLPSAHLSLLTMSLAHLQVLQMQLAELICLADPSKEPLKTIEAYQEYTRQAAEEWKIAILAKWGE